MNNCTDNRTGSLTTAGVEWKAADFSGRGCEAISAPEVYHTTNLAAEAG